MTSTDTTTAAPKCTTEYVRYTTSAGDRERVIYRVDSERVSRAVWSAVFIANRDAPKAPTTEPV